MVNDGGGSFWFLDVSVLNTALIIHIKADACKGNFFFLENG